jgi:chromosomal replication initiator protein
VTSIWSVALAALERQLDQHEINLVRPLHARETDDHQLLLLAPNPYALKDFMEKGLLSVVSRVVKSESKGLITDVKVEIGSLQAPAPRTNGNSGPGSNGANGTEGHKGANGNAAGGRAPAMITGSRLDPKYTFENFVEGKSNQMARAAAIQVAQNPGSAYNPLFIYGGVGLGKTHLMHSIGNAMAARGSAGRVAYVHSADFVSDMVNALQHNRINEFKAAYRSLDALLIDDIQFFARKERSQEEFFHTYNALIERDCQIILTSDKYPNQVDGLDERLSSRFGASLTVEIEQPELETGVAILRSKAEERGVDLQEDVAFHIASGVRSNVRELEGALQRLLATAQLTGHPITLEFARHTLKDLIRMHDRNVTIERIQKETADYFKIRVADLHSRSKKQSVTRPRQIAMALGKQLTRHSLPEIGEAFGGRDHTTVLHAVRKINELRRTDTRVEEDYKKLWRILTR